MKIISINVNGIRAAARKGMYEWLKKVDADIICLQELKAQPDQIEGEPYHPEGMHTYLHAAEKKGYSGVALYCKQKPDAVHYGLGDGFADADSEGRYIQADFGDLSVASLYMPSGSSKDERQEFKIDLMARMEPKLKAMIATGRQYIICGDWNIVHKKRDIKNWRGNQKRSGFLPEEQHWMKQLPHIGYTDAFRQGNHDKDEYSWWPSGTIGEGDAWRTDLQIISAVLKNRVEYAMIYKSQTFSSHLPVIVDYDLVLESEDF